MIGRLLILLCSLLVPASAGAQHIVPQLVAEGPAPPGGEVELAIHMRTAPGWHGYWQNPGDAGLPMTVDWQLPRGLSAAPLRYPVPTRLTVAGLVNYVFERDYALLVRIKVPPNATGTIPVRAAATWLACTDKICVPERGELSLDVPVGQGTPNRAQFDTWRQALPQPLVTPARFAANGNRLRIAIPLPGNVAVVEPYVFPITDKTVDYEAPQQFRRAGDWVVAELTAKTPPRTFDGVLALKDGRGLEFHAVPGAVPNGGEVIGSGGLGAQAALWAVLGALAGGILLNLMPCVFPILALKALHLSRAGGSQLEARSDALGYAAGAIIGTGTLGALLLIIRAAGEQVGWAFQLQDPRTIVLLLMLAVAITANLLGLFELPVLGGRAQPAGSFGTGVLAAFIATPCAGPFLGAALGTALLLPTIESLAIFAALGLGLALPFVAVAFVPPLRTRLPKPGPWMDRLKRFLAIPMAASAIAALWLVYRLGGTTALASAALSAIALAAVLVGIGLRQRRGVRAGWPAVAAAFGLVAASAFAANMVPVETQAGRSSGVETWSEPRVATLTRQGRPVFVYFTADWCLTCKVNEAAAIDRTEVRDAFANARVTVLEADWTNGDPAITRFLESRGRAGVPLYLWYGPGKPPEELPQVLTPSMLIARAQAVKR